MANRENVLRPRQREGLILSNNNAERLLGEREQPPAAQQRNVRMSDLRRRGTYRTQDTLHRVTLNIRRQYRRELLKKNGNDSKQLTIEN